jgi:two-component system sensor histidine kinase and response regulator WspE
MTPPEQLQNLLALESVLQSSTATTLGQIKPLLEALMRASHSIKGAARVVQIDAGVRLAHLMEDCFSGAINETIILRIEHIDYLLKAVDFFRKIAQVSEIEIAPWLASENNNLKQILEEVGSILSRRSSDHSVPLISLDDVFPEQDTPNLPEAETAPLVWQPPEEEESNLTNSNTFSNSDFFSELEGSDSSSFLSQVSPQVNSDRFVRVSAENLNRLMGLAGEALVEATALGPFTDSLLSLKRNQLELSKLLEQLQLNLVKYQLNQESENYLILIKRKEREYREILGDRLSALESFAYRSVNLSDRLYREVIASHMRPFSDGVQALPRMVRDLSKELNKAVKFEIIGKSTPVDRDILKKLEVPLTHILRNALDHGIETSQERLEQGKNPVAYLRLEAAHRFGMLSITIADDGRGINLEKLRQTVIDKQLVTLEMGQQLSEAELLEFIFLPGFSTANQVTEISGRGVGLNIAKTMVEEVGGNLQAISKLGRGTSFHFQLPLTLSVIRTLLVEISGECYAFPLTRIDQAIRLHQSEINYVENRQYFILNGHNIGLIRADQVLDLSPSKFVSESFSVVIISDQLNRYGLVVDQFLGEKNLVIRPLDNRLGKVQDISAAAILEDGSPVLILDVLDLVRSIDKVLTTTSLSQATYEPAGPWKTAAKRILVIDDSPTVREMERKILINQGYLVDGAVDGMEGWNALVSGKYDLVITDIDMPRLNGIKLVNHIKKHPQLKSTPVIIVSYKDREDDRLQGLEAGADYYLTKSSFHDDTLINAVADLLGI